MAAPPHAEPGSEEGQLEDRPPFLTWRGIYALVLGALAVEVILFALLARGLR
jgi:hypothetical protein